ncbi:MAG: DUF3667 domain-containing protein [Bacteroidota bacterium]
MNENEQLNKHCLNCQQALAADAKYCHNCGQKVTDGRVTMKELFREFLDSVFNIDTKFFRTIGNLFIPGKLTVEYFRGKHKYFLQPIRLFLIMTILLVAAFSFLLRDKQQANTGDKLFEWREQQHIHDMILSVDTIREQIASEFEIPIARQAVDTFYQRILTYDVNFRDTIQMPFSVFGENMRFARVDYNQLSENELIEQYYPERNFLANLIRRQELRFVNSNQNVVQFLLGKITWLVFIIIPIFALFLKLLYIRKDFYYVEHLIFLFHVHTLVFLWAVLIILLDSVLPEAVQATSIFLIAIYIVFAMRRFYQQRWWKTIVKFFVTHFAYWFVMIFGIILTAFLSLGIG